ncbi:hypothetical protein [Halobacillus kuroshimensis]|uniref:hypothetical protein n=1 Tax=Halobacillus kuroshimensis TaxID=302481 RepID=UPI00048705DD|nr:hypothetical protein [Halobacillus kuroshimensis]
MLLNRKSTTGKWLAYPGIWIFAAGFSFSEIIGMEGMPNLLGSASIPMIGIGLLMLIISNFFKEERAEI